jgi:rhamnosyltransferase
MKHVDVDEFSLAHNKRVCAVIVTYHGGRIVLSAAVAIIQQVGHLIIVDNHSDTTTLGCIDTIRRDYFDKVTIILNDRNRGLAAALNQGAKAGLSKGFEWILTLDQDSEAESNMVCKMLETYQRYSQQDKVGIIAPHSLLTIDRKRGEVPYKEGSGEETTEVELIHTSGNLVSHSVFKAVGLFREDYFIDQLDYEFCFRVKKAGFKILVSNQAVIHHRPGDLKSAYILYRQVFYSNHSAIRRYYITRNGILLSKEVRNWKFLKGHTVLVIKELVKVLLYEDYKWAKLRLTLLGVKDGVVGKVGKLERRGDGLNECSN